MRTTTRLARIAALPLAATLLVACGGGDGGSSSSGSSDDASPEASGDSSYCQELEKAQDSLSNLGGATAQPEQLEEAITTFEGLAESAPADVSSDWNTISSAFSGVQDALDQAGIEISDLANLQSGQLPEGVTQQDLQPVITAVQGLQAPENAEAAQAISEHAKSECDIDLGGGASESPSPSPSES